jgi:hypothetical protein
MIRLQVHFPIEIHDLQGDNFVFTYRMIQEEMSIFWKMIVSVIVKKKILLCEYVLLLWMVTEIERFESTNSKSTLGGNKAREIT